MRRPMVFGGHSRVKDVHPSGYYTSKKRPMSDKVLDDQRPLGLLKQAWLESGCVYGYRKLTLDMCDLGERCGKHCVDRLLPCEGIRSQTGYRRRGGCRGGKPAVVAPNHLNRQFTPDGINRTRNTSHGATGHDGPESAVTFARIRTWY